MADNQIVGSISINTGGIQGDIAGGESPNDILKNILEELKASRQGEEKQSKLGLSGLLGGKGGGFLTGVIATTLATAGIVTGIDQIQEGNNPLVNKVINDILGAIGSGNKTTFEKVFFGDEEKVLEIDEQTGKILRYLTIEEAKREGILTSTGDIKENLDTQNSIFDKITRDLPKVRGSVELIDKNMGLISVETQEQKVLMEAITNAIKMRLMNEQKAAGLGIIDPLSRFQPVGSGYADLDRQQSITAEEAQKRIWTYESPISKIIESNNRAAPGQSTALFDLNNIYNIGFLQ